LRKSSEQQRSSFVGPLANLTLWGMVHFTHVRAGFSGY
jgi:hypothetical protein